MKYILREPATKKSSLFRKLSELIPNSLLGKRKVKPTESLDMTQFYETIEDHRRGLYVSPLKVNHQTNRYEKMKRLFLKRSNILKGKKDKLIKQKYFSHQYPLGSKIISSQLFTTKLVKESKNQLSEDCTITQNSAFYLRNQRLLRQFLNQIERDNEGKEEKERQDLQQKQQRSSTPKIQQTKGRLQKESVSEDIKRQKQKNETPESDANVSKNELASELQKKQQGQSSSQNQTLSNPFLSKTVKKPLNFAEIFGLNSKTPQNAFPQSPIENEAYSISQPASSYKNNSISINPNQHHFNNCNEVPPSFTSTTNYSFIQPNFNETVNCVQKQACIALFTAPTTSGQGLFGDVEATTKKNTQKSTRRNKSKGPARIY